MAPTLEELLYETASRSLEQQERQVAELRARTGTVFALDVRELHAALFPDVDDDRLIHARLAYELHDIRADNQPMVDQLFARFRGTAFILAAEVLLWITALALS